MNKIFALNYRVIFVIFILVDIVCVGLGMGVPFFPILLGFVVGWYSVARLEQNSYTLQKILKKTFLYALFTSFFTCVLMMIIWIPFATQYFASDSRIANSGIPMILYEPRASFIGWVLLMVGIAPFLQLLTTLFAAYCTVLIRFKKEKK